MITSYDFWKYKVLQNSGKFNMVMEMDKIMKFTNLKKEQILDIFKNYDEYARLYDNDPQTKVQARDFVKAKITFNANLLITDILNSVG